MKSVYLDDAENDKLLHRLLLSLACWLMLARRLCIYNVGLKVDVAQEISIVIITKKFARVKDTVVLCVFCFWQFTLPYLGLATHYLES